MSCGFEQLRPASCASYLVGLPPPRFSVLLGSSRRCLCAPIAVRRLPARLFCRTSPTCAWTAPMVD
eukprot:9763952-Alexandrium_andersonii.AAC.1